MPLRALVLVACLLATICPRQALGQEQAAEHFERGMALFKANNFEAALTDFEAAYRISRSWKVLIHIGITQSRLVRYLEARATLRRYLEEGGAAVPPSERAGAGRELKAIETMLVRVTLKVVGGPADLEVDGRPAGRSPLGEPVLLDPGPHSFRARRPSFRPAEVRLDLPAGARREVLLTLERETALLHVESKPSGASVALDGRAVGQTPWQQRLPAKTYRLALSLEGHEPAERRVVHDGQQPRQLNIKLDPLPQPPPPWYTRWYWWTAIGVVVTAATVSVAVAAQPRYDLVFEVPKSN